MDIYGAREEIDNEAVREERCTIEGSDNKWGNKEWGEI